MKQNLKLLFLYYVITITSMNIFSCSCVVVKQGKDLAKAISSYQYPLFIKLEKRVSVSDLKIIKQF